jgi:hypothetical protein
MIDSNKLKKDNRALKRALKNILNYTGGWDLTDPKHPIVKAQKALKCAS